MAGICYGVVGDGEASTAIEPSASRTLKRRKMEHLTYKFIADVAVPAASAAAVVECSRKRQKLELGPSISSSSSPRECENASVESFEAKTKDERSKVNETLRLNLLCENSTYSVPVENPKFGVTSVCGRRRDMEDAVSVHPCFSNQEGSAPNGLHFYGVFDGHGCSHVNPQNID